MSVCAKYQFPSMSRSSRNFQLTINLKLDLVRPVEWVLINEIAISPRLSNKMTRLGQNITEEALLFKSQCVRVTSDVRKSPSKSNFFQSSPFISLNPKFRLFWSDSLKIFSKICELWCKWICSTQLHEMINSMVFEKININWQYSHRPLFVHFL